VISKFQVAHRLGKGPAKADAAETDSSRLGVKEIRVQVPVFDKSTHKS
jgi:hypothetical protein